MKLQVVELPEQRLGEAAETPYLIVLSEVDNFDTISEGAKGVKESVGARAVLVFEDPVEVLPRATAE